MPFKIEKTTLEGVKIIEPVVFKDGRGFFMESYKKDDLKFLGDKEFVQDNHSYSFRNVLRGLHFQKAPFEQGKLVRVVKGEVWDIAVDLRRESPTFKKWFGINLSEQNKKMLYIPEGFAHGFLTLKDDTHFLYKCTNCYSREHDSGIRWDDQEIGIDWPLEKDKKPIISQKDAVLPLLRDITS